MGIYTGIRILAETFTLKWENIELYRGFLTVEAAYEKGTQPGTRPLNKMVDALTQLNRTAKSVWVFVNP